MEGKRDGGGREVGRRWGERDGGAKGRRIGGGKEKER